MKYSEYKKAAQIINRMQKRVMDINKLPLAKTPVQRDRELKSTRENLDRLKALMDRGLWADNEVSPDQPNTLFF